MLYSTAVRRLVVGVATSALALGACGKSTPRVTPSTAPISRVPSTTTSTRAPGRPTTTTTTAPADLAAVHLALEAIGRGLSSPVAIAFRPGSDASGAGMYVAEQGGTLRRVQNGQAAATPALDLRGQVSTGNEQGLLGAAFSADGAHLYVDFTDAKGDTNVDDYTMRGTVADAKSRRRVLFVDQPYANHNGGEVTFGPDGKLYIGLGDGGSEGDPHGNGQNLGTLLSKILRIDPNPLGRASYRVPSDNPFVGRAGAMAETWMWGLRNPWRFSFDRTTGDTWIGDVGQNQYEEIDFAPHGQVGVNWGWSQREGLHAYNGGGRPNGARDPIIETSHDNGWCAIVGGYVYRGAAIPALDGVYLYGDNCRSGIVGLVQRGGRAIDHRDLGITVANLTTFGEDGNGELYAAARGGTIYRIVSG